MEGLSSLDQVASFGLPLFIKTLKRLNFEQFVGNLDDSKSK